MSAPSDRTAVVPAREAPYVPGHPLIGNSVRGFLDTRSMFVFGYQNSGPVFTIRYPGQRLTMIAGLAANELLARETARFDQAATYALVTRELGTTRIPNGQTGEAHKALRRVLAPSLSSQGLEPWTGRLHDVVRSHVDGLSGDRLGASALLEPLVTDLVTWSTAGRPAPPGLWKDVRRYGTWMGAVGVGRAFPEWLLTTPWMRGSRRRLDAFLRDAIAHHRREPPHDRPADLVDALITESARDPSLDPAALLGLALLPLKNAGIYLARMLGFALWEVLRDPGLLERVRAEVDLAWAGGPPDLARLRRCATLQGVLLEALRMWPMALALPRVVAEPFVFGGHAFDRDQLFYVATTVTHFVPELFPDPERFDPDRYAPGRLEHRRPNAWVPFGVGPHACLARGWSLALAAIALGGLLRAGGFAVDPPQERLRVTALPSPVPEARFSLRLVERRAPPAVAPGEVAGVPLVLDELDDAERKRLDAGLRDAVFPANAIVFRQGDPSETFHVIRSGAVDVIVASADGVRTVARLGPGDCFGEIGLLQGVPRTATVEVTADGPLTVATLTRDAFELLAVEGDLLREELIRTMERRATTNQLARALRTLEPALLARAGAQARRVELPAGATVVRQGEPANHFYVLLEGAVEVLVEPAGTAPFAIATLSAVDYFGEIGLLAGRPRTATVRVAPSGPATVLELDTDGFRELMTGADLSKEISAVAGSRLLDLLRSGA